MTKLLTYASVLGLGSLLLRKTVPAGAKEIMNSSEKRRQSLDSYCRLAKNNTYDVYVKQLSSHYHVSPYLVHAIIYQESRGLANAVGGIGERGLMQITKIALTDFNDVYSESIIFKDLFNPFTNIQVGTGYLALLERRWGDIYDAVVAYNAGNPNNKYAQVHYLPYVQQWEYYFKRNKL